MNISYSVVIRTLGNSGEKYLRLLQSIARQTVKPESIIVAIPNGYDLDYQLGNETIIRCEKGMVTQRAEGINAASSEYILVVDDDLEFDYDMVERLYRYLVDNDLDCCLPMQGENAKAEDNTINLKYPLSVRIRNGFTGQMFTSRRKSAYLDVLTATAGHKVFINSNKLDNCYFCTTACFQCFFIKTEVAKSARFEEEKWLEQGRLTSYSAFDEPVFFSKLNKKGLRMAYALRVRYRHLNAQAGHIARTRLEDKRIRYYSIARNRSVYWYKFIWKYSDGFAEKLMALVGGIYGFFNYTLFTVAINCYPKYWKAIGALFLGYRDALCYIRGRN
ncbi:MAG: glycosyltransferase family 2 protein [Bacteroidales bacterium]|nr:glycosyltransferase family 2 protein [Bacteroidales bacterium]